MPSRHSTFLYCKNFVYFSSFRLKNDFCGRCHTLASIAIFAIESYAYSRLQISRELTGVCHGCAIEGNSDAYGVREQETCEYGLEDHSNAGSSRGVGSVCPYGASGLFTAHHYQDQVAVREEAHWPST